MTKSDLALIRRVLLEVIDDGDPRFYQAHDPDRKWRLYAPVDSADAARLDFADRVQGLLAREIKE